MTGCSLSRHGTEESETNQMTIETSRSRHTTLPESLPADAWKHQSAAIPRHTERNMICCGHWR